MKKIIIIMFMSFVLISIAEANYYGSAYLGHLRPPDGRGCFLFQLQNVSEADPITPGIPWFAIPTNYEGYSEIIAIILSAKMKALPVAVSTTGKVIATCGHAEAFVEMP